MYREGNVRRLKETERLRAVEGLNFAAVRQGRRAPAKAAATADQENGRDPPTDTVGDRPRRPRPEARKTLRREVPRDPGPSLSFVSNLKGGAGRLGFLHNNSNNNNSNNTAAAEVELRRDAPGRVAARARRGQLPKRM